MATGRDIEAFADLRAAMEAGDSRDEVLERAGMTSTQWVALQRRWLRALALEADRGGSSLLKRYERRMTERSSEPKVDPPAAPAPPPPAPAPAAPMPAPATPAPTPPQTPATPSPWAPATPAPPAAAMGEATQFVQAVDIGAAVPFGDAANTARPAAAGAEVAAEGAAMAGGTAFVAPISDEVLGLTPASESSVDETAAISGLDLGDLSAATPFGQAAAAEAPAPAQEVHDEQAALAGGTAFVGALTDEQLAPAKSEALSLEQYASLVADLSLRGDARAATLARYGLDERSFVSTKSSFNRRFAEDPGQHGAFRKAYDAYAQWLSQSGDARG